MEGAAAAAKEAKIEIETNRLYGLLGMLRQQNLPRRTKLLGDTIAPLLSQNYEVILDAVQKIRNATAHGGAGIQRLMPKLSPTTYALASMCAIWDQKTSGMPFDKLESRLNAQNIAEEALQNLARVE